uniref:C2 NT-type domain-containing protein n=1 Tax=Peronospora matthiolae TaxID=2874970 RepID=A0AAV1T9D9_9STRA
MSHVTWRSSWSAAGDVNVQLASDTTLSLTPLPLRLTHPADNVVVPCKLSLLWTQHPLCCSDLQLEVRCSARHVELYVESTRRNLLGEDELCEVYLGTFRGTKESSEPPLFVMSPRITQSDRTGDVLRSVRALHVKFVSLTGDKSVLKVHEFQCGFVPVKPAKTDELSTAEVAAAMHKDQRGHSTAPILDVEVLLRDFQQKMETKVKQVIDAKLSMLSQRLALSEQALYQMHKKMDAKHADVQDSLNQIRLQFSNFEDELSRISTVNDEAKQHMYEGQDEMNAKAVEKTGDEQLEGAPVATETVVADGD